MMFKPTRQIFALTLSLLTAWPTSYSFASNGSGLDLSAEKYNVNFQPVGNRRIIFRDESGRFLGHSAEGADLELQVDGNVIRSSMVNGQPDVKKILDSLPSISDTVGRSYMRMSLPFEIRTAEGNLIPPGTRVLIDKNYFIDQTVLPAGATGDNNAVADRFNDRVIEEVQNNPQTTIIEDEPDVPMRADRETPPPAETASPGARAQFPTRFLSAPTCGCPNGCRLSSDYGRRPRQRTSNGRLSSGFHQGIDISGRGVNSSRAVSGAAVVAAADGVVVRRVANRAVGYGVSVYIDHGNGYVSQYSHLDSIASHLRIGDTVRRGDRIGTMGHTGNSTAPHLHFGLTRHGRVLDPLTRMLVRQDRDVTRACADLPEYAEVDAAMEPAVNSAIAAATAPIGRRVARAPRATSVQ